MYLLEKQLSSYVKSKFCVTVGNGTDALLLSLMALGIKKDDEIITSNFSFISAVEVIKLCNAKPILIDIDKNTANIDTSLIEKKITKKTKAILYVNLFGNIANYSEIVSIAKKHKIKIIEDAAQSFGAKYKNKFSCNLGDISCTSFFPTKPLGCYGDGGAIFCNNKVTYLKLKKLRNHGQALKYKYQYVGYNSRLDTIQASILLAKLKNFQYEIKLRKKKYFFYKKLLHKLLDNNCISLLNQNKNTVSCYSYFNIIVKKNRINLEVFLNNNKIPFQIYYPKPLNEYKYLNVSQKEAYPVSRKISKSILSLPFDPYIKSFEQIKVVNTLENFFNI